MADLKEDVEVVKDTEAVPDLSKVDRLASLSISSRAVHADDHLNNVTDVAPPIHLSTTFRYDENPENLLPWADQDPTTYFKGNQHIYSRYTAPNTTRLEAILTSILNGPTITYGSGLAAFHAILVYLNPRRISIGEGYHGCHKVISLIQKLTGVEKLPLDCPAEELQPGDVIHVETPLNPRGTAVNLAEYAKKAKSRGAILIVDATFAPPPLQDPFVQGADVVFHSGTKYLGGHSDLLCGTISVSPERAKQGWVEEMIAERACLGGVVGSLEGWLGVRSLRTLEVRVKRQSESATKLVKWFYDALQVADGEATSQQTIVKKVLKKIEHASLQFEDINDGKGWLAKQMPGGFGPVFSIVLKEMEFARRLPSKLLLFHHATSLGGVESLIEWRTMSDAGVDRELLRISVGLESWEDLRDDLVEGFKTVFDEVGGKRE